MLLSILFSSLLYEVTTYNKQQPLHSTKMSEEKKDKMDSVVDDDGDYDKLIKKMFKPNVNVNQAVF